MCLKGNRDRSPQANIFAWSVAKIENRWAINAESPAAWDRTFCNIIQKDVIELSGFQKGLFNGVWQDYRVLDTRMVPFLILIVTGLGISGEKRMCESIIWIAEIGRNIGCFLYSGFILNNFSKWRGNTSFYLTLFSVTLSRAKHLGAAGSHSFEQFPAVKCASKLKSHEHIQNTLPRSFEWQHLCFWWYKGGAAYSLRQWHF